MSCDTCAGQRYDIIVDTLVFRTVLQCDVCKRRNELNLSRYEFDIILDELKEILRKEPKTVDELNQIIQNQDDKVIKVIQWLLDNNKIKYTEGRELIWK